MPWRRRRRRSPSSCRAIADRREGMARLVGKVACGAHDRGGRSGRTRAARARPWPSAEERARTAQQEFTSLESQIAGLDEGEVDLDSEFEGASQALAQAQERVAALREEERAAEQERVALIARVEALEMGLDRKDGSAALLAATDTVSGLLGSVAAILTIEPGAEAAVAAALGAAADAVAVDSIDSAVAALTHLKRDDAGRAGILVGGGERYGSTGWPDTSRLRHLRRRPRTGARAGASLPPIASRTGRCRRWARRGADPDRGRAVGHRRHPRR